MKPFSCKPHNPRLFAFPLFPPSMLSGVSERVIERDPQVRGSPSGTGIVRVQFDVMNDEEVLAVSLCDVNTGDIWARQSVAPVRGGLLDTRMGSISREFPCEICHATDACPGHMGSITLPRPVLCYKALDRLKTVLRLHCHFCGTLLAWGARREEALQKANNALHCSGGDKDLALRVLAMALGSVGGKPKHETDYTVCGGPAGAQGNEGPDWCGRVQPFYWVNKVKRFGRCTPSGRAWFPLRATWPETEPARAATPFLLQHGLAGKTFSLTGERVSFLLQTVCRKESLVPNVFPNAREERVYLEALAPSVIPVLPPQGRPTDGISGAFSRGESALRLNDITKRYGFVLQAAFSVSDKITMYQGHRGGKRDRDGVRRLPPTLHVLGGPWEENTLEDDVLEDAYASLQQTVDALMDENCSLAPPRGAEKLSLKMGGRSLATDFDHKKGLMRGNIQGKRGNFTGRSVITPDPNMPLDVLAVPGPIADRLTVPVRVNDLNRAKITRAAGDEDTLLRCRDVGASTRSIFFSDGSARDLNYKPWDARNEGEVPVGSTVEVTLRQAVNELGMTQRCIFNRQPTLHRPGMLAERVVVTPGSRLTLAFKETQVTGFNADFDGDEMNVMLPQGQVAHAEIASLMGVEAHAKLPRNGGACYGAIQDTLTASFLLTRKDVFFERDQAMELLMSAATQYALPQHRQVPLNALPVPAILKAPGVKGPLWTGKQMASLALPRWLNIDRPGDQDAQDCVGKGKRVGKEGTVAWPWSDCGVFIRAGELLCGRFDKSAVGAKRGSVGDCIEGSAVQGGGSEAMADFLNALSALAIAYFMQRGFSVGLGDIMLSNGAMQRVNDAVDRVDERMRNVVRRHQTHKRDPGVCGTEEAIDALERDLIAVQDACRDEAGQIATQTAFDVPETGLSSFLVMAKAGSKGTALNYQQVTTCLGGQMIQHRRVVDRCTGDANTARPAKERVFHLPAGGAVQVKREALGSSRVLTFGGRGKVRAFSHVRDCEYPLAEAGGFARHSLLQGLTPLEFIFHAMGGREGLKNTANDTADTGYAQRKMIKNLEDVHVTYDGTVRNCAGGIVQFWYGPDPCRSKSPLGKEAVARLLETATWTMVPHEIAFVDELQTCPDGEEILMDAEARERDAQERIVRQLATGRDGSAQVPCRVGEVMREVLQGDRLLQRLQKIMDALRKEWAAGEGAPLEALHVTWPRLAGENARAKWFWWRWKTMRDAACRDAGHDPVSMVQVIGAVRKWLDTVLREPNAHFEADVLLHLSSRRVLCHALLTWQHLQTVLRALRAVYLKGSVTPGDAVGALAAQSLGESATQKTLNSFHVAGTSSATVGGGEKFAQLIGATPAEKQRGRQIRVETFGNAALARDILLPLQGTTFADVAVAYSVTYCPLVGHVACQVEHEMTEGGGENGDVVAVKTVFWGPEGVWQGPCPGPFVDEAERSVVCDFYATLPSHPVEGARVEAFDPVEDENGLVVQRKRFTRYEVPRLEKGTPGACLGPCGKAWQNELLRDPDGKATQVPPCFGSFLLVISLQAHWFDRAGLAQTLASVSEYVGKGVLRAEDALVWMTPDTNAAGPALREGGGHRCVKLYVRAKLCGPGCDGEELPLLEGFLQKIMRAPLSGPKGSGPSKGVVVENGKAVVCDTEDLQHVLSLDGVDGRHVDTNQVSTVLKLFGVEAANCLLAREYEDMVKSGGGSVAPQHTTLVADVMTQTGAVVSFDRYGIVKRHGDFLLHASFERTSHTLQKAAFGGRKLQTKFMSPSAAIMFGMQPPTVGTASFSVYLDTEMLRETEPAFVPGLESNVHEEGGRRGPFTVPEHGTPHLHELPEWMRGKGEDDDDDVSRFDNAEDEEVCVFSPVHGSHEALPDERPAKKGPRKVFAPMHDPPGSPASPAYSPTATNQFCASPVYSPTSPAAGLCSPVYSPTSPAAGLCSPAYSPTSPAVGLCSPAYSPTSPAAGLCSPVYSPTSRMPATSSSPVYSPSAPVYSPSSPMWQEPSPERFVTGSPYGNLASPAYSPTSPALNGGSPGNGARSQMHELLSSPAYSPHAEDVYEGEKRWSQVTRSPAGQAFHTPNNDTNFVVKSLHA